MRIRKLVWIKMTKVREEETKKIGARKLVRHSMENREMQMKAIT